MAIKRNLYNVLFNLLALTVLVYVGVDIFYRVVRFRLMEFAAVERTYYTSPDASRYQGKPLKAFKVIVDRNLFGASLEPADSGATREMDESQVEALEPTSLKVTLLGTVTGSDENSWAVIQENGKRTQGLYRVGDTVQNGVVRKILRGKVVLRVDEKDEVLSMETAESSKARRKGYTARTVQDGDTITVARSDVQNSLKNINKLLTQARIRPYLRDGKPEGFVLSYVKAGSFFTKLGLRRGDIIKRINGSPINTPEDAFSFYQTLESGGPIAIEISRGGRSKILNYRFE